MSIQVQVASAEMTRHVVFGSHANMDVTQEQRCKCHVTACALHQCNMYTCMPPGSSKSHSLPKHTARADGKQLGLNIGCEGAAKCMKMLFLHIRGHVQNSGGTFGFVVCVSY